jgi:hypothetical protein
MKTTYTVAGLVPILLLTGCIGVIPLPASDPRVHGRVIEKSQTQFIIAGRTTRMAVITHLGGEFRASPRVPALAYSWEKPAADIAWWFIAGEFGAGGHYERSHWRAFFIEFDAGGKVCRTKFARLSEDSSLDEQLEDWVLRKHKSFKETGGGIFDPDTGRPRFIETMEESATWAK